MPRYVYRCDNCQDEFLIFHALKESLSVCQLCGTTDGLYRIPQLSIRHIKKTIEKQKVGDVVNKYIEDTKSELKKEQQASAKEEYKP